MTRSYFPDDPSLNVSPPRGLGGGVCSLVVQQDQDQVGTCKRVRTKAPGACGSQTLPGLVGTYLFGRVCRCTNWDSSRPQVQDTHPLVQEWPFFKLTHQLFIIMRNGKKNVNPVNLKLTLTLTYIQPFASLLSVALPLSVLTTIGNFVFHPLFGCVHAFHTF